MTDYKSLLNLHAQQLKNKLPQYNTVRLPSLGHKSEFSCKITYNEIVKDATSSSKKEAEKLAAQKVWVVIQFGTAQNEDRVDVSEIKEDLDITSVVNQTEIRPTRVYLDLENQNRGADLLDRRSTGLIKTKSFVSWNSTQSEREFKNIKVLITKCGQPDAADIRLITEITLDLSTCEDDVDYCIISRDRFAATTCQVLSELYPNKNIFQVPTIKALWVQLGC